MNTSTSSVDESSSWSIDKGISRSKSGPNYAVNEMESDTIKPSGKPVKSINIKMDCYEDLKVNGSSTTQYDDDGTESVVLRKKQKGSTAIKRRSGNRRYVRIQFGSSPCLILKKYYIEKKIQLNLSFHE